MTLVILLLPYRWKTTGLWARLNRVLPVFLEPRSAAKVDSVLEDYALAIRSATSQAETAVATQHSNSRIDPGKSTNMSTSRTKSSPRSTLLLAVVGGRLAEGINFGDELGRCIAMVGLPYPSPSDPELVERLRSIDRASLHGSGQHGGPPASRGHYQDLCMRAVNQSIGRAIRHSRDYAAILLLDTRYDEICLWLKFDSSTSEPMFPNVPGFSLIVSQNITTDMWTISREASPAQWPSSQDGCVRPWKSLMRDNLGHPTPALPSSSRPKPLRMLVWPREYTQLTHRVHEHRLRVGTPLLLLQLIPHQDGISLCPAGFCVPVTQAPPT